MNNRYPLFHIAVSLLIVSSMLVAGTTGKIAGKVSDAKTKEGIPSAIVSVAGTSLGAATDFEGNYVIVNVPPGTYSVSVSYVGYQPTRVNNVGVNVDFTTTLNIQLKESTVELGEFVVEGERNPLIRQDQTNPVVAVTAENIQSLPVTSIGQIVGLQAGVVQGDDGALHVRGGRDNEISFTLNGISLNNPYNNESSLGVATNALQEVSVSTGTFSAEYGNALSGVVNYVTREGGARYNASVRTFTGDYVSNRTGLFPHIDDIDIFNNARLEGTFGGPIIGEDLSFYMSGVFERGKGYLYGQRIYDPTDFFISRQDLNYIYRDRNGNIVYVPNTATSNPFDTVQLVDPRTGSYDDAFYFNPLRRDTSDHVGRPTGDGKIVPLNTNQSYNIQGNIAYRLSSTMKLKYEFVHEKGSGYRSFYNSYRFNPDGRPQDFNNSVVHAMDWTHTIDNTTFYTAKFAYNTSENKTYVYENYNDPRYLPGFYQTLLPNTTFLTGGVDLSRTVRSTETMSAKLDFVSQLFGHHEVKSGIEVRKHVLDYENYTLEFRSSVDPTRDVTFQDMYADSATYTIAIPSSLNNYTRYKREPLQFSFYAQDKVEIAKTLIMNIGLRYEYFDVNTKYNTDLSSEIDAKSYLAEKYLSSTPKKHAVSPRLSIAYPITDQGVIRFSFGHFVQIADLSELYRNPNYYISQSQSVYSRFGNPNVNPQRSVQYEIGLQQGLTEDLRLEVVGFYKDVKDYIFTQTRFTSAGGIYRILTNLDYSYSKGLTISLLQRRVPGSLLSASVDYTFALAEGNRTEPAVQLYFDEKTGKNTETFLVPLSFDRTHTLNATVTLTQPDDWMVSSIWRLRTGSPYTPENIASSRGQNSQFIQNQSSKPLQWYSDLKIEKTFSFEPIRYTVFLLVDNLFDIENETDVHASSGRALYDANEKLEYSRYDDLRSRIEAGDVGMVPMSTLLNLYADPTNVSRPRLVRFGVSLYF